MNLKVRIGLEIIDAGKNWIQLSDGSKLYIEED